MCPSNASARISDIFLESSALYSIDGEQWNYYEYVFVLSTGRCGSETFYRACSHMTNYTVAHESNLSLAQLNVTMPYQNMLFPDKHIEVDNRLSWFLGSLDKQYGDEAYYVHLKRDPHEVARSYARRGKWSILFHFAAGILQYRSTAQQLSDDQMFNIGLQYCETVNNNIDLFLTSTTIYPCGLTRLMIPFISSGTIFRQKVISNLL